MSQHFQQKQLAWSEYNQFFDKQQNLGKNLNIKFLERFWVLPKSCNYLQAALTYSWSRVDVVLN